MRFIPPALIAVPIAILALAACSPSGEAPLPAETAPAEAAAHGHEGEARHRNTLQTVTLTGADGQTATLTRADLAALPREKVSFDRHGDVGVFEGPLLLNVLARVGVPASPLRKDQQATAILIEAADGYRIVLGLGETDPATRADRIILADARDGQPLSPEDGPFMIVAEGDVRAARSPRMVTAIRVLPLGDR